MQHKSIFLITDAYANNEPPERLDEAAELIEETEQTSSPSLASGSRVPI